MGNYTQAGWVGAVGKTLFGVVLAIIVGFMLKSGFLGMLTFAVLFFIPINDQATENQVNGVIFSFIMFAILIWAFSPEIPLLSTIISASGLEFQGLGISLGTEIGYMHIFTLGFLILLSVFLGVFIVLPKTQQTISSADESMFKMACIIGIIVLFILNIVLFQPWNWNFGAIIFVFIWVITFFNGVFGGLETKQVFGVGLIILAFLIYTFGVGSDAVGSATFGQWWPPVKEFGKQVFGPLKDTVTTMYKSFKDSMQLLICPTCVARDVLAGIYNNPTGKGKTGAFGLEFEELNVPDGVVSLGRPFSVSLGLKNQGAKDAKKTELNVFLGGQNIYNFKSKSDKTSWVDTALGKDSSGKVIRAPVSLGTGTVPQEDAKQLSLVGEMTCTGLTKTDVLTSTIRPGADFIVNGTHMSLKAEMSYDYSIDSQLSLEFISKSERERLLKEKTLTRTKQRSTMTTSPIALSMYVDIDQPIEEQTRFYLGVEARAQEKDGETVGDTVVSVNVPKEFLVGSEKDTISITGPVKKENNQNGKKDWYEWDQKIPNKLSWHIVSPLKEEQNLNITKKLFIDISKGLDLGTTPTKTFVVTAKSDFKFKKTAEKIVKFEFGDFCCANKAIQGQCRSGVACKNLDDKDASPDALGTCTGEEVSRVDIKDLPLDLLKGRDGYCAEKMRRGAAAGSAGDTAKCEPYQGFCDDKNQCYTADTTPDLDCLSLTSIDSDTKKVCCPTNNLPAGKSAQQNCHDQYQIWLRRP